MAPFDYVLAVALVFSFISIFLVVIQPHDLTAQRKIESLIQISNINRQLRTLGFSTPELFDILHGGKMPTRLWNGLICNCG